jgi:hypothetical protein
MMIIKDIKEINNQIHQNIGIFYEIIIELLKVHR